MVNSISSASTSDVYSPLSTAAIQQTAQLARTSHGPSSRTSSAVPQSDTVDLSPIAQAHGLKQQGMSVKTIAQNLGVSAKDVDKYLGIGALVMGARDAGGKKEIATVAAHVRVNPPAGGPKP